MKKFTYLLAVAAVFTACNSGNNGYTVTGTVRSVSTRLNSSHKTESRMPSSA